MLPRERASMRKGLSTIKAMLKHARKQMQQRAQKPLAKHAGETMPRQNKTAISTQHGKGDQA